MHIAIFLTDQLSYNKSFFEKKDSFFQDIFDCFLKHSNTQKISFVFIENDTRKPLLILQKRLKIQLADYKISGLKMPLFSLKKKTFCLKRQTIIEQFLL